MPHTVAGMKPTGLTVSLQAPSTGQVLFSQDIDPASLVDGEFQVVRLPFVRLRTGRSYVVTFVPTNADLEHAITLYRTTAAPPDPSEHAVINGVAQPFALVMRIFGY